MATEKDPRALVVVAHPNLRTRSQVNRHWVEELERHPDEFCVHDLCAAYPTGALAREDVAAEQALLGAHDVVVLQFPLYWYSCPALLRTWMDAVLSFGWAYGGDEGVAPGEPGRALAGKRLAVAVSAGDERANYAPDRPVGYALDEVLAPFWATFRYLETTYDPHAYALYGAEDDPSEAELAQSARDYADWVRALQA